MKKCLMFFFLLFVGFYTSNIVAQSIEVKVGDGLDNALAYANTGAATEIILVDDGGQYVAHPINFQTPLKIKAKDGLNNPPVIIIKGASAGAFWKIDNDLELDGIIFDGYDPSTSTYDSVKYVLQVSSLQGEVNEKPNLTIRNCIVRNIYAYGDPETSTDGTILDFAKGARAGDVLIENNIFMNTGDEALRAINTHKSPTPVEGKFSDNFTVRNCTFHNIRGSSIKIEGDSDSTTVDTKVIIDHCTFNHSQRRVIWHRDLEGSVIKNLLITNLIQGNDQMDYVITVQRKGTVVSHIDTFNVTIPNYSKGFLAESPSSWSGAHGTATIDEATIYNHDPMYKDPDNADFTLDKNSPVLSLGDDGKALGDLRWAGTPSAVEETDGFVPNEFQLKQNYPNPFNPSTTIEFNIAKSGNYTLKVYNLLGQEVRSLMNNRLSAGSYKVNFDATDLPSGVYVYKIEGNNVSIAKKMLLLK